MGAIINGVSAKSAKAAMVAVAYLKMVSRVLGGLSLSKTL